LRPSDRHWRKPKRHPHAPATHTQHIRSKVMAKVLSPGRSGVGGKRGRELDDPDRSREATGARRESLRHSRSRLDTTVPPSPCDCCAALIVWARVQCFPLHSASSACASSFSTPAVVRYTELLRAASNQPLRRDTPGSTRGFRSGLRGPLPMPPRPQDHGQPHGPRL